MSGGGRWRAVAALLVVLLAYGLARAASLAWICDDAFISLRYAQNLVAGHGLVYNPGEYVEGYTNLLWTLALAAALAAGLPDLASAIWLGIACYVGLAALLVRASFARARDRPEAAGFWPLAAGVVLVSPDFHEWASGGLETALFALLATWGTWQARRASRSDRAALGAGALLALATLTRPDGLLFAGAAALGVAWREPRRLRGALLLALPVALVVAAWLGWKLHYYGELLPTAFHSKSVLRPYYSQGAVYLGLYLAKNWFLPAALLALVAWRIRLRRGPDRCDVEALWLAAPALLYWLYVVHVGGDFMFARRVLPAVPLLLLALEEQLATLPSPRWRAGAAAACVAAAALPFPVFDAAHPRIRGVADERRFYPEAAIEKRRRQAEAVGEALRGTGARVMFEGGMCVFGYYSGLPYLAEMTGLTHYSLAKLPLEQRGWIGHEKRATREWLDENDIHLIVGQAFPPVTRPAAGDTTELVFFRDLAVARIHRYDPEIMAALATREGVDFVPIDRVIERRRREIARATPERAREILDRLERYYFRGAGEHGRREWDALRELVESRRSQDDPSPDALRDPGPRADAAAAGARAKRRELPDGLVAARDGAR